MYINIYDFPSSPKTKKTFTDNKLQKRIILNIRKCYGSYWRKY